MIMYLSSPSIITSDKNHLGINNGDDDDDDHGLSFKFRKKNGYKPNVKNSSSENSTTSLQKVMTNRKGSISSSNYDADSDSSEPEHLMPIEWEWTLKCELCSLIFSSPYEDTFKLKSNSTSPTMNNTGTSRKKLFRQKYENEKNNKRFNPIVGGINFEEFKDISHKMDKFDPDCERKWTLQYFNQNYQPKLAKIIVGRGHRNEFPELNSIHLINEMRDAKKSRWRNDILSDLQFNARMICQEFELVPKNNTCQFCFFERTVKLNELRRSNMPFSKPPPLENQPKSNVNTDESNSEKSCNEDTENKKADVIEEHCEENGLINKVGFLSIFRSSFKKSKQQQKLLNDEETDDEEFTVI